MKKNIVILATGGTIAGYAASSTEFAEYKAGAMDIQSMIDAVPMLAEVANVSGIQVCNKGSYDFEWDVVLDLSKKINTLLQRDDVDGIVVTHGTDVLEETAYFLNLTVKSEKPVVVVGAMRPTSAVGADGPVNLLNAVILASSDEAIGQGTLIALNDQIGCARDCTKTNTTHVDTFRSFELGYLGYMQNGKPYFYRKSLRKHGLETEFDIMNVAALPRVDIIYTYLGYGSDLAEAAVQLGAKGIILAAFGRGNIRDRAIPGLAKIAKLGVPVVRSSRTGNGVVIRHHLDDQYGFIAGDNLNPQKARVLLTLALLKSNNIDEIRRMFAEY